MFCQITYAALDRKVPPLTEVSVDSDLTNAAYSGDDKDQTDVCGASSVGVELPRVPTAVITVKGMLVI